MKPQALPEAILAKELLRLKHEHDQITESIELLRQWQILETTAKSGSIPDSMMTRLYRITQSVRNQLSDVKSALLDPESWLSMWEEAGRANAATFAAAGGDLPRFTRTRSRLPVHLPRSKAVKLIERAIGEMDGCLLYTWRDYAPPEED